MQGRRQTQVRGERHSWQTGCGDLAAAITLCGPKTGHSVQSVAFCQDAETADVLVSALLLVKLIHDQRLKTEINSTIMLAASDLLDRAGLLP